VPARRVRGGWRATLRLIPDCPTQSPDAVALGGFVGWQVKLPANPGMLVSSGGPEAIHGELEFAALVSITLCLVPSAELQT
jgi:hypothetical protein